MTLQEAIKLQTELVILLPEVGFNKYAASILLGIEALKRVRFGRNHPSGWELEPLPGETKE